MTKLKRILSQTRAYIWLPAGALVAYTIFILACGSPAPFPASDPPPTFAIHYTLSVNTLVESDDAIYGGSTLKGDYRVDILSQQFNPAGHALAFGPVFVPFRSYYTVEDGRWPAQWSIVATGGCGAGTPAAIANINTKVIEAQCVVTQGSMSTTPRSWSCMSPPAGLALAFDRTVIPSGTLAQVYVVDNSGRIYQEEFVTVDGSGHATISTPDVPMGTHTVAADFQGLTTYGAQTSVTISGPVPPNQCP